MLVNWPLRSPTLEVGEPPKTLCDTLTTSPSDFGPFATYHCSTTSILSASTPSATAPLPSLSTPPPQFESFQGLLSTPQPSYFSPMKHSKVEFPKFDGTDFKGWATCCHQFFDVDEIPVEHCIHLLSIHLEKCALHRHRSFVK